MIPRYTPEAMGRLWSDETKFQRWIDVELAALWAWVEEGHVPADAVEAIAARARSFDPERMAQIEREVHHDVVAFTQAVAEAVGPPARFFHYGLTSSDVTDTALCLILGEALDLILADLGKLQAQLAQRALAERDTLTAGRTHGVLAEPMALGLKFALLYAQLKRDERRLRAARGAISVGKLSGAIGTFSQTPPQVERRALERLGLAPAPIATQILQRDRHAEVLASLAILGGTLEKMATDVRLLQRSEIREMEEPFGKGQKGSSAMPHKRNPVRSERIVGLSRLLRGYAVAGFEDMALWHERDISHSSVERVALQDATTTADYMVREMTFVVEGLVVDRARMAAHLQQGGGLVFSQKVLLALTQKGLSREDAYRIVQRCAMAALTEGGDFRALLQEDRTVKEHLPPQALDELFDVGPYLAHVDTLLERSGVTAHRTHKEDDR